MNACDHYYHGIMSRHLLYGLAPSCKACPRCGLGMGQLRPRDGLCRLRRRASLLTLTLCLSRPPGPVPQGLKARGRRLPDARLRAPQYLSTRVTHVARDTLFGTTRRRTRLAVYRIILFICTFLVAI